MLNLDTDTVYDPEAARQLADALNYRYPYGGDTGLYAMLSVSELKKQGQVGQDEEEIGRGRLLGSGGEARILGDVWTDGVGEVGPEPVSYTHLVSHALQALPASGDHLRGAQLGR